MSKQQKKLFLTLTGIAIPLAFTPAANAMHIMEGFLPLAYCIAWGVLCIPFLAAGYIAIRRILAEHRRTLILLAMCGAYVFVLSSLKIPSVTGSSSHPTGTGLGAILFGPSVMSILGLIVLIFQALLLAHGGLSTLGANTFSMAIAGPFFAFGVYKLTEKLHVPKYIKIFLAACLGDLFTYCVTAGQLTIAHPAASGGIMESLVKFLGVFAVTQIPLAVIEGIITVIIFMALETYAKPELKQLSVLKGGK